MKCAAVLVALLLCAPQDGQPVTYAPPVGTKEADLEKTCKTLEKRCQDFGFRNVTAKVEGPKDSPYIVLSCSTGVTPKMRPWIDHLTRLPALKVEVAFEHLMNDAERQQYDPGKTAPNGLSWAQTVTNPLYPTLPRDWKLFRDKPRISVTGNLRWTPQEGDKASHFTLTGPNVKAFRDVPKQTMSMMQILVDGQAAISNGAELKFPDPKSVEIYWTGPDTHVGVCLNNPLPVPLEVKK